jgi:hypothetical protein
MLRPVNEIDTKDLRTMTQRFQNALVAVENTEIHAVNEDAVFDEAATAGEELAVSLIRYYRNQKMISLLLDEIASAVKEGY